MWMRPCMFFGRLQQTLLLLHLSHYSRSLGAYSCVGHDFIRTMLFFWLPQYVVCLCVCEFYVVVFFGFFGWGGSYCMFGFLPTLSTQHAYCSFSSGSFVSMSLRCPLVTHSNSTGALLGCDWVCTWSLWWLLYISFCESFKCCLQKGRIKHDVLSTKGFTSADFEKKILLRTDLSYALNIIRWVEFRENLHLIFSVIPFDVTAVCGSIGPKLGTEIFTT